MTIMAIGSTPDADKIGSNKAIPAFIALAAVPVFPDFTIPDWVPLLGGIFVPSIAADLNIGILFDNLMKPFLLQSQNGQNITEAEMKKNREAYIKRRQEEGQLETAYVTREFSVEELEALLDVIKTPAIDHESKAVFAATAYALKEFFLSLASRYDVNKHKR